MLINKSERGLKKTEQAKKKVFGANFETYLLLGDVFSPTRFSRGQVRCSGGVIKVPEEKTRVQEGSCGLRGSGYRAYHAKNIFYGNLVWSEKKI